jgi:hypothetical protein
MSSGNYPYFISITGDTSMWRPAAQEIKTDLMEIKTMLVEWGGVTKRTGQSNMNVFRSMIWSAQIFGMYLSFLYMWQIRQETTTNTLANAQDTYNDAVKRYGPSSEQAIRAARNLENAQLLVNRATTMTTLMMASFGMQAVVTGAQILSQIPALNAYASSLWTVASAKVAASGWLAPAMAAAIGVGVGAVAGYAISQAAQPQININNAQVTVSTEEGLDTALDKFNKKVKEDYKSMVGG